MKRPEHFEDYPHATEITPGVFVDPGNAVYLCDEQGEVATWNCDEVAEDPEAFTAAITAVVLAASYGASEVRKNIDDKGATLDKVIDNTADDWSACLGLRQHLKTVEFGFIRKGQSK